MRRLKIYAINLERAADRREVMARQLSQEMGQLPVDAEFLVACDGHAPGFSATAYADFLPPDKPGNPFKPGALACYLSHASAWERIARGSETCALIVEDDVLFNPKAFEPLISAPLPAEFDILFVNYRMHKLAVAAHQQADWRQVQNSNQWMDRILPRALAALPSLATYLPVSDILEHLFFAGYYRDTFYATGGDGYIVSKLGAQRLLGMMQTRKIRMGVDYAMALNSLSARLIREIPEKTLNTLPGICKNFIKRERNTANAQRPLELAAYIHTPDWLVKTHPEMNFPSTIQHKVFKTDQSKTDQSD